MYLDALDEDASTIYRSPSTGRVAYIEHACFIEDRIGEVPRTEHPDVRITALSLHLPRFVTLTYARPMDDPFAAAERQLEDLLKAAKKLRATLLRTETLYRQTLKGVRRRSGITATIKANRFDTARQQLTDALKEFEGQRHRTRGSVILAQLAEGERISEVGRSWGFSHQLASKYAREATGGSDRPQ
jgi:hypothetical protein